MAHLRRLAGAEGCRRQPWPSLSPFRCAPNPREPLFSTVSVPSSKMRRSLLALWLLTVVYAALMYASDRELNLFIGTVILGPVGIALNVGWLWLVGCFWWQVSLFRVGAAWQNTAALLFRAVRPVAAP